MTLRKQLMIYVIAIIVIPFSLVFFIPFYHYNSSPERVMLKGLKELRQEAKLDITEDNWNDLYTAIRNMPPDLQAALVGNGSVLISTIPELEVNKKINGAELWAFIKETSNSYLYQFETPPFKSNNQKVSLISRHSKTNETSKKRNHIFVISLSIIFLTIIFCIIVILKFSKIIFKSIQILEKQMMEIANGNLDIKIDIDEKDKSNNEITSINGYLEKMKKALKTTQEKRSRFIMGISHDLRTPIAVIKGYTEGILDGVISTKEEINDTLKIIAIKINQLESMINTLISYEKLNSDLWQEKLEHQKLYPILNDFFKMAEQTGTIFNRIVKSNIKMNKNITIPMNSQLLTRALENIFSNALRYTKNNDNIYLSAIENNDSIKLNIIDTGIGISKEEIPNIFDLFYRGTSSRREEGMGIGLSVVKNVIDIHKWSINVYSDISKGTDFEIIIPKTLQLPEVN